MYKKIVFMITLSLVITLSCCPNNMSANELNESVSNYVWVEENLQTEYLPPSIRPQLFMEVFDRYEQSKVIVDWKHKYVGDIRGNNSANLYTPLTITFKPSSSGTFEASGTVTLSGSIELNAIISKVERTATVSATASRKWSKGVEYGAEVTIPPARIGMITAYIPGSTSTGISYFKVYNTSNNQFQWLTKNTGAIVPAKDSWNFVVKIT